LFSCLFFGVDVHSQNCSYESNGYTLTLSNIPTLSWYDQNQFNYSWTPCQNGYSCLNNANVMAGQLNTKTGNCNKLAVWNSSVPGNYNVTTKTWTIEFNNGGACGTPAAPRTTIFYLFCEEGSNMITQVTNPSGTCTYDFKATGPGFCASVINTTTTTMIPTTTSTTETSTSTTEISTTTTSGNGSSSNSVNEGLLAATIILSIVVAMLCCVICFGLYWFFFKHKRAFGANQPLASQGNTTGVSYT